MDGRTVVSVERAGMDCGAEKISMEASVLPQLFALWISASTRRSSLHVHYALWSFVLRCSVVFCSRS